MSDQGHAIILGPGAARGLRLGAVVASFNHAYTARLLRSAEARLKGLGGRLDRIEWVPGALELPQAAAWLLQGRMDAVLALGCVIRGETSHYDLVCQGSLQGLQRVALDTGKPVAFGVITVENRAQALARCGGGPKDAGKHAAETAVAMARLRAALKKRGR
jgi:6,7-dimethyl-8-ribityllumazine synthase